MPAARCTAATPVRTDQGRLLSRYGVRPGRTSGMPTFHAGLDFAASPGQPVFAVKAGTVEALPTDVRGGPFNGYGNAVVLRHPDGTWSFYAHLRAHAPGLRVGQAVGPGALIGGAGNTTNGKFRGMGAHLHFEVRHATREGRSPFPGPYRAYNVDPAPWLAAAGITFGPGGHFVVQGASCAAETLNPATGVGRLTGALGGLLGPPANTSTLRGLGQLPGAPGGDYEPPVPDLDLYLAEPSPWLVAGGVAAAGIGLAAVVTVIRLAAGMRS
ncbi:MAG: M23 family metallopeptidase [Gemmatimonadota bacterium]|nr:MAG: M23 family metallopeptidase [Gemmatimonadota bacterium]